MPPTTNSTKMQWGHQHIARSHGGHSFQSGCQAQQHQGGKHLHIPRAKDLRRSEAGWNMGSFKVMRAHVDDKILHHLNSEN